MGEGEEEWNQTGKKEKLTVYRQTDRLTCRGASLLKVSDAKHL